MHNSTFNDTNLDCSDFSYSDFSEMGFDIFINSLVTNCCFYNTTLKQNYIDPFTSFHGSIFLVLKDILYFRDQKALSKQGGVVSHPELYTCLTRLLVDFDYTHSNINSTNIFYIREILLELIAFGKSPKRNDHSIWSECLDKLERQYPHFLKMPWGWNIYYEELVSSCKEIIPLIRVTKAGTDSNPLTKLTKGLGPFQNMFQISDFLTPKFINALIENFHGSKNLAISNDAKTKIIHDIIFEHLEFTKEEKLMLFDQRSITSPILTNPQVAKVLEAKEV